MLRALMSNSLGLSGAIMILISYGVLILLLLPVHEMAHGFAAYRLGDPTARNMGRLTLNPFAHLDKFGSLMMLLVGFGYAKPVPVNPRNFRNPTKDMALTALAGPLSNFLMAVASVGIYALLTLMLPGELYIQSGMVWYSSKILLYAFIFLINVCASVNLSLMVFNLLPIPPLDGSRIFAAILPAKWVWNIQRYENYVSLVLFALIFTGVLDTPLYWLRHGVGGLICRMFGLPNLF